MPFFSVVIPVYNKAKYLKNTIESVLSQTFDDYEIIIINDGSTDESEAIIKQFDGSKINYFFQENKGVSCARNFGIDQAAANYIAFLDADDFWFPNHLSELKNLIADFPNCGMYCNRYTIKTAAKHFQKISFRGITSSYRGIIENYFYSNKPFRVPTCSSIAVSKEILLEFNSFNKNRSSGEDVELFIKIGIKYPIAISNETTVLYNFDTPDSLSKQPVETAKVMDLNQFKEDEKKDLYLKEFLDLHRFFYAIQFKSAGNLKLANALFDQIDKENIGAINLFLFSLPSLVLQNLYMLKRKLKKIGLEFSTYN